MSRKRFSAEQIVSKLREVDVLLGQGLTVTVMCKPLDVTDKSYHPWRREDGGLKVDEANRLKDLEKENARLKRLLACARLDV